MPTTLTPFGRLTARRRSQAVGGRGAFTLIEVILAIGIAAGILMVVLFFYRQTSMLRDRLLEETSTLSAVRLVLDRMNAELSAARSATAFPQGLSGGPDHLEFVKLDFPQVTIRTNQSAVFSSATPFRRVSYSFLQSTNAGDGTGLFRSEEPLSSTVATAAVTNASDAVLGLATPPAPAGVAITPVQFLQFRYWNGTNWVTSWSGPGLPRGVEVSLGTEPLPPELTPEEYPFELFRRVIYLPNYAAGSFASGTQPKPNQEATP